MQQLLRTALIPMHKETAKPKHYFIYNKSKFKVPCKEIFNYSEYNFCLGGRKLNIHK